MTTKSNPKAHTYEKQADALLTVHPSAYKVGSFIWGIEDEWTEEYSNFKSYISDLVFGIPDCKNLCKILRIEEVDDLEKDANPLLSNWEMRANEGSLIKEDIDGNQISYRNCAMIRDKAGRYIIVAHRFCNPNLPLCFLPTNWRKMFPDIVKEMSELVREFREKQRNEWVAQMNAKCRKWAALMTPVPKGIDICDGEYFKIGMKNVTTMATSVFPQVQFSVSYAFKWDMVKEFFEYNQKRKNGRYILEWTNGPTEDEVENACDFFLFCDCSPEREEEYDAFASKYGGVGLPIELRRKVCDCSENDDNSTDKKAVATIARKPSKKSKAQ